MGLFGTCLPTIIFFFIWLVFSIWYFYRIKKKAEIGKGLWRSFAERYGLIYEDLGIFPRIYGNYQGYNIDARIEIHASRGSRERVSYYKRTLIDVECKNPGGLSMLIMERGFLDKSPIKTDNLEFDRKFTIWRYDDDEIKNEKIRRIFSDVIIQEKLILMKKFHLYIKENRASFWENVPIYDMEEFQRILDIMILIVKKVDMY
ncbi:MAG: hypothetical protein AB1779_01835 [Candidatus Thermoplasmatota archaeon]